MKLGIVGNGGIVKTALNVLRWSLVSLMHPAEEDR